MEKFPNSDFVKLHGAQCFIRLQEVEKAEQMLTSVEKKNNRALYHLINGRYAFEQESYIEAISSFRSSLQLDADQPIAWSFSLYPICILINLKSIAILSSCVRA